VLTPLPAQKWNEETAAHLLNRAAFGGTPPEIGTARKKGLATMVRELVDVRSEAANVPPPAWAHPRNIREMRMEIKAAKDRGENFQEKARQLRTMEGEEILDLRHWWLDRMMNGPAPLLEKMTLFWHGHFATSVQKIRDGYFMWLQNDTLRRNALGNFGALVKKISRDPAMMIYLDLQQSRKEHPNENWARELMELFTVGIGNYTEPDIRESTRAFTGYRIDMTTQRFRFAPFQQDKGVENFMGRTGAFRWRRHHRYSDHAAGVRAIHWAKAVALLRRGRSVAASCGFGREPNSCAQLRDPAGPPRNLQLGGILFRAGDAHTNQESGSIHHSNFETARDAIAFADRRAKCDAADGPDSFRTAERERLGRRQSVDQYIDIVISL
jgi:hypothetical protein